MTDTPPSGAGDDARVHGSAAALSALTITHVDRPLSAAEADAVFAVDPLPPAPSIKVNVDASVLQPSLTALVRWLLQGLGALLVAHGMAQARADGLVAILGGLAMSGGALAWSLLQKRLASRRIRTAAAADPAKVVLR